MRLFSFGEVFWFIYNGCFNSYLVFGGTKQMAELRGEPHQPVFTMSVISRPLKRGMMDEHSLFVCCPLGKYQYETHLSTMLPKIAKGF